MGFRQLLERAVKPSVMVGVVGMLSLSLIMTTPSNAYALQSYPKIPPAATFVMGAAKTVAPAAMAVASVTPIGWGLRLAQLGFLAYSTADMWMPFVTGSFGVAGPSAQADAGASVYPGLAITKIEKNSAWPWVARVTMSYTGDQYQNGALVDVAGRLSCRKDGVTTAVSSSGGGTFGKAGGPYTSTPYVDIGCPGSAYEVVGAVAGPFAGSADIMTCTGTCNPGPENVFSWGDAASAGTGFDPLGGDVGYQGKSECVDSAGTISWVTGPTVPGNNGAMLMPSCEAAGKGHGTGRTKVEAFKPDGTTQTVWDTGAQPLSDPATPLCDPGRSTSGCVLEVTKDGQPCRTGDVECENWSSESQKEGNTRYGCKLGPYVMPLSACSLLEKAYHPGGSPLNDENTDGNPSTSSPLGPNGQPAPSIAPTTTGTVTGGQPVPGGSGQTGPGADDQSKQCYPTGWAMANPVEWVMKPVGCALRAAFVPKSQLVQAQGQRVQTKLATVGFAPITAAFLSTVDAGVSSAGGCQGPTVTFQMSGVQQSMTPFNACTAPMSTVAGITNAVSAVGIVLFGGLGMMRALSSAFGFNFTMGSKGAES